MSEPKRKNRENRQHGDRAAALNLFPLPPETEARLVIYADLLHKWQKTINLVAASTLPQLWTRHFADSLQVQAAMPAARIWADLGAGAGFPGLVTAIRLADVPGVEVHLIESDQRKCAFLREVSRETLAPAIVHQGRIEDILPELAAPIEAVSARALAPVPILLGYAENLLDKGAVGLFLKGEHLADELTDSAALGTFARYEFSSIPSVTSVSARLLVVKARAG
ncbi:16S rRNA (guanine(527)-N(7))-methyltransferase RsmG [Methylovirgula sp. HY1]|uniref:16S rRNA (guanine(527)-N(7))-methyltransferase RsmG n=1 Tax=Methylovirgula sp. HY1 TaxID=2822761 RepID=UPI001C5AF9A1|nr:16S rRNA (guanine(527)-N(7))-methyltransferase RsmG [Methylovirgula sp. HY1]QXX75481.1 Ribosomal RNA small subunit methyltransferase G [Methylovirgula sp. HY1]